MDQPSAEIYCKGVGGRLAYFETEYEYMQYMRIKPFRNEWIGMKKYGSTWRNLDGSRPILNWARGEPNNRNAREGCGMIWAQDFFQMNDTPCTGAYSLPFTCRLN